MTAIELITSHVCPFAQRTHMALIEKGLAFSVREVDLSNKPTWFEDISPTSKVPVVKIADEIVWESAIANEYIEEKFPDVPLLPDDPWLRAQARIWIDYCNTRWVEDFYMLLGAKEAERRKEFSERVRQDLRDMETRGMAALSSGPFWLGPSVSLVDLAFWPFFERLPLLSHYREVSIPEDCRRLVRWCDEMASRPSARQTMHEASWHVERYRSRAA